MCLVSMLCDPTGAADGVFIVARTSGGVGSMPCRKGREQVLWFATADVATCMLGASVV